MRLPLVPCWECKKTRATVNGINCIECWWRNLTQGERGFFGTSQIENYHNEIVGLCNL